MNPNIKIAPATTAMTNDLVVLSKHLGYETKENEVKNRLANIIKNADHYLVVALDGEKAVGFAHGYIRMLIEVPLAVEIGGLVVDPQYRNQGIGRNLIEAIEKWTQERGIAQVVLSSNVIRKEAHQFYEHLGYENHKTQYAFRKELS